MNESAAIAGFEERVRRRAYALWEQEGCPAGRDAEHWRLSEAATRAELAPAPKPRRKTPASKRRAAAH